MTFRVVHIVRQYTPSIGGTEGFVRHLCRVLAKEGVHNRIVTLYSTFDDRRRRLPALEVINGVPVARIAYVGGRHLFVAPGILRQIRDADIVHVHGIDFFVHLLGFTRWWHRKPVVVSTHGGFFHTRCLWRVKQLVFHTATRLSLSRVSRVIANSESDYDQFAQITRRCEVLENGVDVDRYLNLPRRAVRHRWLSVCRLSPNKRIDRLIETFSFLVGEWPDLRLDIVGPAAAGIADSASALATRLGVRSHVRFHGRVSDERLDRFYSEAECFVTASDYEGFGMSTVEAMAAGAVALVNDIPSLRSFVRDNETGLVVRFEDPRQAASDIRRRLPRLLETAQQVSDAARQDARQYAWSGVARRWLGVYRDMLGRERRNILGVPFRTTTASELIRHLDACIRNGARCRLAIANAHTLNEASVYPDALDCLRRLTVVNDGLGVDLASYKLYGAMFPENLQGSDFVPRFLGALDHPVRVYLLGGAPGVADAAGRALVANSQTVVVAGTHHGLLAGADNRCVIDEINASEPDVLLVGLGDPLQECWIATHSSDLDVPVCIGVGALFDFLSGRVRRAPTWMRRLRAEWLFRLLLEPKRMWRRYLIGNVSFLRRVWVYGHTSMHDVPHVR